MISNLNELDLLLGESLEFLVKAAHEAKNTELEKKNQIRMNIGRITAEIWEIRNYLYDCDPTLKTDLVKECEQNQERSDKLTVIQNRAYELEQKGDIESAFSLYSELLKRSKFGYFRRIAEAGLYRTMGSNCKKQKKQ
jgi:hypothetical protein